MLDNISQKIALLVKWLTGLIGHITKNNKMNNQAILSDYEFSQTSLRRLKGVDDRLVILFKYALKRSPIDFGIAYLGGFRTAEEQHELYMADKSTKDGYLMKSKHQFGEAVDFIPYVDGKYQLTGKNAERYYLIIIGVIFACAAQMGIRIRSGANWDKDEYWVEDQSFIDLPHIELI